MPAIGRNPRKEGWTMQQKGRIKTVSERYERSGERRREAAVVNERDKKWRHRGALE